MTTKLAVQNVNKTFEGEGNVLEDVSFELEDGESVAIVGPSGAGKTTILRLASGAIAPDAGEVAVGGKDLASDDANGASDSTALVYQERSLIERRSALSNVLVGRLQQVSALRGLIEPLIPLNPTPGYDALEAVGIEEEAESRVDELSAGQRQRVSIARSLVQEADVLLADEPTANLDPQTRDQVLDVLMDATGDRTLAAVLHDVELAVERFPRVIGVGDGTIAFDKDADDITEADLNDLFDVEQPARSDDDDAGDDDEIGRGCWDV